MLRRSSPSLGCTDPRYDSADTTTAQTLTIRQRRCEFQLTPVCSVSRLWSGPGLTVPPLVFADRIIYKGQDLDVNRYARAELRSSDHRPGKASLSRAVSPSFECVLTSIVALLCAVYAIFQASIRNVDHAKRSALRKELLHELLKHGPDEKLDDKLTRLAHGSDEVDLPPPSDDQRAWWNDESESSHVTSLDAHKL